MVDLIDYCARKITALSNWPDEDEITSSTNNHPLESTTATLPLRTHLSTLSILRHITTHISSLPLSVTTRILGKHDMIVALVYVLERRAWERKRRVGGKWVLERFGESGEWREVGGSDREAVVGWEAQVCPFLRWYLSAMECRTNDTFFLVCRLGYHSTPFS